MRGVVKGLGDEGHGDTAVLPLRLPLIRLVPAFQSDASSSGAG
jgi:hypothetical protein